MTISNRALV